METKIRCNILSFAQTIRDKSLGTFSYACHWFSPLSPPPLNVEPDTRNIFESNIETEVGKGGGIRRNIFL